MLTVTTLQRRSNNRPAARKPYSHQSIPAACRSAKFRAAHWFVALENPDGRREQGEGFHSRATILPGTWLITFMVGVMRLVPCSFYTTAIPVEMPDNY